MTKPRKKLIEVALPLEAINAAAAREKSIRHGHPSTLHLWWARRPLAAARAVIFAQMVDDPSSCPELFRTEQEQDKERQRLFALIEQLVQWENTTNERVLQAARDEIWQSWRRACADYADHPRAKELFDRHKLPAFHDPFAGGGSLPLEAQRLGLEAYASDLNPVAVLINKAMIEIPPKFAGLPPVNPEARASLLGAPLGAPASSRPLSKSEINTPEWRSRGYLPHRDAPGLLQSVTFRLADALPASVLAAWEHDLAALPEDKRQTQREQRINEWLDQGHGACYLRDERIAALVEAALLHNDGERYRLLAWCIMPNHVHVLIEQFDGQPLSDVVHSWKSYTATKVNALLGRNGSFWQREYHDRFIRDERHYVNTVNDIENNPVKAGLVERAEEWRYSSAARREREEERMERRGGGHWAVGHDAGTDADAPSVWRGAQGLAEDVRYYGKWMRDEAEKRIGHLYPKIEITAEMAKERPDLERYVGQKLTVIAWLWARTVKSPNPAFSHIDVPLATTFMLSTRAGKEAYVEPVIEKDGYRFTVKIGKPEDARIKYGTKTGGSGSTFLCLMSGTPMPFDYLRSEAKAGRMKARMMAIVAEGEHGRVYLAPTAEMERVAAQASPSNVPDVSLPAKALGFRVQEYGMVKWRDLFTPRQLVALTTFADLVAEVREKVIEDIRRGGWPRGAGEAGTDAGAPSGARSGDKPLRDGGCGATAYAEAVCVYLSGGVSQLARYCSTLCAWNQSNENVAQVFGRQALPMVWDYAECHTLHGSLSIENTIGWSASAIDACTKQVFGSATQYDARTQMISEAKLVSTDPPYYDNIGYADLSDFFYVWLRRSLQPVFPDLFATVAVPKAEELVATPYRHGSKDEAEKFFLDGMTNAMRRLAEQAHPAFPVTIYYAFKQAESENNGDVLSTGWDTFLAAVIAAGFAINGTWPMRTEKTQGLKGKVNALASSIVLVCRKRAGDAPSATRREFLTALKAELPAALVQLQKSNIAPVDLAQAAIGPGMAVYTRYSKVFDAEGKAVTVREALALINQTLDEVLAEQEGDFDADSRWALAWFGQYGFDPGEFGVAETLSKAKNTSVSGMMEAGIVEARAGKVRLLKPGELPADWDPERDVRLTVWEMVHQLIRALERGGETAAAALAAQLGSQAEAARELCYRLYTICERKKRAQEALSYNALVQSWPEIQRLANELQRGRGIEQGELL